MSMHKGGYAGVKTFERIRCFLFSFRFISVVRCIIRVAKLHILAQIGTACRF